jgi:hypothetical protein
MLVLVLVAVLAPAGLLAADATDEVLVRFRDGTSPAERAAIALEYGLLPAEPEIERQGLAVRRARADALKTETYLSRGRSLATLRRLLDAARAIESDLAPAIGAALRLRREVAMGAQPTQGVDDVVAAFDRWLLRDLPEPRSNW